MTEPVSEAQKKTDIDTICSMTTRNDKMSWERKMNNMVSLLADITPIEDQILQLLAKKQVIYDQVSELRAIMVKECVHPYTHLVHEQDYVLCKFCERKIVVRKPDGNEATSQE
jgi:hypothetical protein